MKEAIKNRFLQYVSYYTESKAFVEQIPSTQRQFDLAKVLVEELKNIGLSDVELDENCYIYATLPSNIDYEVPTIGFVAHIDTSPDLTGENVKPQIWENYDGTDIRLNAEYTMQVNEFPKLKSRIPTLWTRSYYCESIGHISEEAVKKYIEEQKNV